MALEREFDTYQRHLNEFLRDHDGEYVLILGDDIYGFYPTRDEALVYGYGRCGRNPFFVKKIQADEPPMVLLGEASYAATT